MSTRAKQILHETMAEHYAKVREADEFEREVADNLADLSAFIRNKDTRTFCILIVSFLEDALKRTFIRQWKLESAQTKDSYFGSNGPLSTFAQRILIASAVGWLPPALTKEAGLLRKIRNEFAHNHRVHLLSEPPLQDIAATLQPREHALSDIPEYAEALQTLDAEKKLRVRVFCSSVMVVGQILFQAKMMHHGLRGLKRDGGYSDLTGVEQRMIDITVRHCFCEADLEYHPAESCEASEAPIT